MGIAIKLTPVVFLLLIVLRLDGRAAVMTVILFITSDFREPASSTVS